jgi:hypothetical protein
MRCGRREAYPRVMHLRIAASQALSLSKEGALPGIKAGNTFQLHLRCDPGGEEQLHAMTSSVLRSIQSGEPTKSKPTPSLEQAFAPPSTTLFLLSTPDDQSRGRVSPLYSASQSCGIRYRYRSRMAGISEVCPHLIYTQKTRFPPHDQSRPKAGFTVQPMSGLATEGKAYARWSKHTTR